MKHWCCKTTEDLESELNAFSKQGYRIYKIWRTLSSLKYPSYNIIAYKEMFFAYSI